MEEPLPNNDRWQDRIDAIRVTDQWLLSEAFLRTRSRIEVPLIHTRRLDGARYPTADDLVKVVRDADDELRPGDIAIRYANPIVRLPGTDRREVLYGKQIVLPSRLRDGHIEIVGPTGSGKTTLLMLNLLLSDLEQSLRPDSRRWVYYQTLKGNDFPIVKAWCHRHSRPLIYVDFNDPQCSVCWNPLAVDSEVVAHNVISTFVKLSVRRAASQSEFWEQFGTTLLIGAWSGGFRSFPALYKLLNQPIDKIAQALQRHPHPAAQSAAAYLQGRSDVNVSTAVASVVGWLELFNNPNLRRTIAHAELDLGQLFREGGVLYMRCQEDMLPSINPIYRLFMMSFIQQAIAAADANREDAMAGTIFIEDLPAWGPLPLAAPMATLRSRRISIVAAVQSRVHLAAIYDPAEAEMVDRNFTSKFLLPNLDELDARFFSTMTGEQLVGFQPGIVAPERPPQGRSGEPRPVTTDSELHDREFRYLRPVLTANDIRNPTWHHPLLGRPVTVLLASGECFQAYLAPYYLRPDLVTLLADANANPDPTPRPKPIPEPAGAGTPVADVVRNAKTGQGEPPKVSDELKQVCRRAFDDVERMLNAPIGVEGEVPAGDLKEIQRIAGQSLGLQTAGRRARSFWSELLRLHETRPGKLSWFVNWLASLAPSVQVDELRAAFIEAGTPDLECIHFYLLFRRRREMVNRALVRRGVPHRLSGVRQWIRPGRVCPRCRGEFPPKRSQCPICGANKDGSLPPGEE